MLFQLFNITCIEACNIVSSMMDASSVNIKLSICLSFTLTICRGDVMFKIVWFISRQAFQNRCIDMIKGRFAG